MLELLIKLLQATLQLNAQVGNVFSLAELIPDDEGKHSPYVYCTKDELKAINLEDSTIYFRKNGRERQTDSLEEAVSGCDHLVRISYPIIAVAYVPKSIYNSDNNFADDKIANNIANFIRLADYSGIAQAAKADQIFAEITEVETDRNFIWNREYRGHPIAARQDHALVSVSFDLIVEISESCLTNFDCSLVDVIIEGTEIIISISDTNAWHKGGDNVATAQTLGPKTDVSLPIITNNIIRWNFANDGHFIPEVDDTYDIGSSTISVRAIYVTDLYAANIISPDIHSPVTIGVPASGLTIDGNQVLTLAVATSLVTGALSASDWSRFDAAYNMRHNAVTIASPSNGLAISGTQELSIALAGAGQIGVVSATTQTFDGAKTFNGLVTGVNGVTANGVGLTATVINGLTTGTTGTNFNITSAAGVHTFNLPDASASNRGVITTGTQTIAGAKTVTSAFTYNEGSAKFIARQWTTDPTYTALYLGNVTPAAANYTMIVSPTQTQVFINSAMEINMLINNSLQSRLDVNGYILGGSTINARAKMQVDSTTKGFLPPRMTTVQKNAIATPPAGLVVYDSTLQKLCVYTTAWETITSV